MADGHKHRDRTKRLVVLKGAGTRAGVVWLVGAGPGDPDLLTVRALRLLQAADVVVHDRLAPQPILDLIRPAARLIDVGKRKSFHTLPQEDINQLLVGLAREGLTVVRLKGGDPFMFGRGGEELAVLREAGVEAHVVPGVTAALAAGLPLTHRGLAQAVTFVTGHAASGAEPDLDWTALAKANQTVVVYMGLSTAPRIAARLVAAGRAGSTPVLVVENASQPDERRVASTLGGLAEGVRGLDGPALLVIGEVAALEATLGGALLTRETEEGGEKRDRALGVGHAIANDLAIAAPNACRERQAGEAVEGALQPTRPFRHGAARRATFPSGARGRS
jgi:uroporphyrin-III C-methyltransferase